MHEVQGSGDHRTEQASCRARREGKEAGFGACSLALLANHCSKEGEAVAAASPGQLTTNKTPVTQRLLEANHMMSSHDSISIPLPWQQNLTLHG